jgi:hypothetical protein
MTCGSKRFFNPFHRLFRSGGPQEVPLAKIVSFRKAKPDSERYPLRGLTIRVSKDFDKPAPELWGTLAK